MPMKLTNFLCLCSLILAGTVFGEEARPPRTDINPALLYYQSFLLAPEISKEDRSYLFESQEWSRGQKLPDRFGELISSYGKQLRYARHAAKSTVPCDWG